MDALTVYKEIAQQYLSNIRNAVNGKCAGIEPWQLITSTVAATFLVVWLYSFLFQSESLISRFKKWFFRVLRKLPIIGTLIQNQMDQTMKDMASGMSFLKDSKTYITSLPVKGLSQPEVLKMMKEYSSMGDIHWEDCKVSGTVYSGEEKITKLLVKVPGIFPLLSQNVT